jgi:hypothetical protein
MPLHHRMAALCLKRLSASAPPHKHQLHQPCCCQSSIAARHLWVTSQPCLPRPTCPACHHALWMGCCNKSKPTASGIQDLPSHNSVLSPPVCCPTHGRVLFVGLGCCGCLLVPSCLEGWPDTSLQPTKKPLAYCATATPIDR